jgi:C-terminal processing protease CtpA/Prc
VIKKPIDLEFDSDDETEFTFEHEFRGEEGCPYIVSVEAEKSAEKAGVKEGFKIVRANGFDLSILAPDQVEEMLQERPIRVRFLPPE